MSGWLVVGLGNPGPTYAGHRHNVGYLVADVLAARIGARFSAPKGMRAEVAEGRLGPIGPDSVKLALMKSRTYMNETGGPVSKVLSYFALEPDHLIAIHDELDIDPGQIRVKFGGRRQRPQRPEVDPPLARHRRLLPRPGRGRSAARPPGAGRLPAVQLLRRREGRPGGRDRARRRRRRVPGHGGAGADAVGVQLLAAGQTCGSIVVRAVTRRSRLRDPRLWHSYAPTSARE